MSGGVRQGIGTETSSAVSRRARLEEKTYRRDSKKYGSIILYDCGVQMFLDTLKPAWL